MSVIPKTTQAAILVAQRTELTIDEIELPQTLDVGQVLVELSHSGICGSQLGEIAGVKGADNYLPHLLGHEGAGVVMGIGPGVRHVSVGQRVVLHWRKALGIDARPPLYRWRGEQLNAGQVTTFNQHAVVAENRLTPIPDGLDNPLATLFGCALTTGFGVICNNAKLQIGESLVVLGAGGVGLNMIQAAAMTSAHPIIAVDLHDSRLELAKQMGADILINASSEDVEAVIQSTLGKADVVIDNTGNTEVMAAAYRCTKPAGRTILVGVPRHDADITIHSLPLHFGKLLTGSHGGEAHPETDIPRLARLHAIGRLPLDEIITAEFSLSDINEAMAGMRDGRIAGRCLINLQEG